MDTNFDYIMNSVIDDMNEMVEAYNNSRKLKLATSIIINAIILFLINILCNRLKG
jgi:hypothetical protein